MKVQIIAPDSDKLTNGLTKGLTKGLSKGSSKDLIKGLIKGSIKGSSNGPAGGSVNCLTGKFIVPGDKSISHRAIMLGAIAQGVTEVTGFLTGEDCLSTISCFRNLGVDIQLSGTDVTIKGTGQLSPPDDILDVGNSGTTLRLMTGLLAGQSFTSTITGDDSIKKRPMKRVTDPLSLMGAQISGATAPVIIKGCGGRPLEGISYTLPVASAQVKSAILLASLYAKGETIIEEPIPTRDHMEIMLNYLGADIEVKYPRQYIISRGQAAYNPNIPLLKARPISVPGDISSAAFLIAAAVILPGSEIIISNVGCNPTRTGIIHVLNRMGADIRLQNERIICGETVADILVRYSPTLKATTISGPEIPSLIDEIPIIAAVALFAQGETIIKDAAELRVKETDRIKVVSEEFQNFFESSVIPQEDGMIIRGMIRPKTTYREVDSRGDHRLAMSLSVLALAVKGETVINNAQCADISFPGFYELLPNTKILHKRT